MNPSRVLAAALAFSLFIPGFSRADKQVEKAAGPLVLKLTANKKVYDWDGGGLSPQEFQALLEEASGWGWNSFRKAPRPPAVDLVLQIVNRGDVDATIYVGGDANRYTFDLQGPGVATLQNRARFRGNLLPKAITLAPGKSHDIPVKSLCDGFRSNARNVYWAQVGEYTLTAEYQLSDAKGGPGPVLRSEAVALKIQEIHWGQVVNGLQAGLAFQGGQAKAFRVGQTVPFVVKVRNVTDKAIDLLACDSGQVRPTVEKGDGFILSKSSVDGFFISHKRTVNPGQVIELLQPRLPLTPNLEQPDMLPGLHAGTPVKLRVRFEKLAFLIDKASPPAEKLATGQVILEVRPSKESATKGQ